MSKTGPKNRPVNSHTVSPEREMNMSVFEMPEKMPAEIAALKSFSSKIKKDHSLASITEFDVVVQAANAYLDTRYKELFGRKTNYSNEHIAETVFEYFFAEKQIKPYIKCSWQAVERFLQRTAKETRSYLNGDVLPNDKIERLEYFWESVFDVALFLNYAESTLDKKHKGYGVGKRTIANSSEIFTASIDHLKHFLHIKTFSHFIRQPTAAFLLRQAIELRIKNGLGIYVIFDKSGSPAKITPDTFVEFIYSNDKITIPVKKSILKKIHGWTNYYIHGGMLPELWKIELAQELLTDLFNGGEKKGVGMSLFGSIQIDINYFENQLYDDIANFIIGTVRQYQTFSTTDIYIQKMRPEALLV